MIILNTIVVEVGTNNIRSSQEHNDTDGPSTLADNINRQTHINDSSPS